MLVERGVAGGAARRGAEHPALAVGRARLERRAARPDALGDRGHVGAEADERLLGRGLGRAARARERHARDARGPQVARVARRGRVAGGGGAAVGQPRERLVEVGSAARVGT